MTHAPANPPKPVICLSMMERLIHDTTPANAALWTPDALNQHHVLRRSTMLHLPPEHHSATNTLPCCPTTLNLPDDQHEGFVRLLATLPPPAPDPPDSGKQPCHSPSHHTPGQATGPTCNLHPPPTAPTRHHHPPPYFPLAQNIKALAHNMWPP